MSYLLTEIAMEMLGWQFYDTDGVPRPLNLEGANLARTANALPLEQALNIKFVDEKTSIKTEDGCSSSEEPLDVNVEKPLPQTSNQDEASANDIFESLDKRKSTATSESFIVNNTTDDAFAFKIESVAGGVNLDNVELQANFYEPLEGVELISNTLETQSEVKAKSKQNFNLITTTKTPISHQETEPAVVDIDIRSSIASSSIDASLLNLQQKLEKEMFKTALDLNREKNIYFKSLTNETKKNSQEFRKAIETYRRQELQRLQNELQSIYDLRLQAEQLAAAKFPKTYPRYLTKSTTLSPSFLENAKLTMPILGTTNTKLVRNTKSLD